MDVTETVRFSVVGIGNPANASKTQESVRSGSGENCDRAGLWLTEGLYRLR